MFADDTSVSYAAKSVNELQNVLNSELKNLHNWLITNRLSLNIAKTKFMAIGSRQKIRAIDDEITIKINEREINRVDSVKSLGVYIDNHLTWEKHVDKMLDKIASAIGALKRIRPYITTNTAVEVYQALIQPHFDYCCSVWDGLGDRTEQQGSLCGPIMTPVQVFFLMPSTGTIFLCIVKSSKLV